MGKLLVTEHPLLKHKLSLLRAKETSPTQFRALMHELSLLLAYEVTRSLELRNIDIETPLTKMHAPSLRDKTPILVSILRAGNGMLPGFMEILPTAKIGHVGLYRDKMTHNIVEYFFKLPIDVKTREVFVLDPMLATGNSLGKAIDRIKELKPTAIKVACILAAPEGIEYLTKLHPDISIFTCSVDAKLDANDYIVPGLGDAGDRLFGTL